MVKAIIEAVKQEAKPAKLIASALVVVGILWVLVILKKQRIASPVNPLEA